MTRESPWDEEQAGLAQALVLAEQWTCSGCGGWLPETMRTDVHQMMEQSIERCEDCAAIDATRERWHKVHDHDRAGAECDCADQRFYVAAHKPMTTDTTRRVTHG